IKKGIIQNPYKDSSFNLDGKVKRAEFVKTLLEMLCIIPRKPDAYLPYSSTEAGGGFSDIIYNANNFPWYYPYVKEGAIRQLVNGYIGEGDRDPITGLAPFKPENNITRAEAVKIIIQAIAMQGIIDNTEILKQIDPNKVWYEPFMKAALDLTPYMKKGSLLQNNFIITEEEYKNPDEKVSYLQLMIMVNRVLQIYNCFEMDENQNGMSDYCERKYDITDPNEDFDADGSINSVECTNGTNPREKDSDDGGANDNLEALWGTNPLDASDDELDNDFDGLTNEAETLIYQTDYTNPDTDGGGVNDGDEVNNNTDPLNGEDDISTDSNGESDSSVRGLYIVPAECDSCPCFATLLNKADVIPGDVFFSVIFNSAKNYIFKKSEELSIKGKKI
ncbi:MAG: S-layer homology domain-containing protein, partial [Candidatus Gracilibacteria bacterium]